MLQEQDRGDERKVAETEREREEVDVKQRKVQKEHLDDQQTTKEESKGSRSSKNRTGAHEQSRAEQQRQQSGSREADLSEDRRQNYPHHPYQKKHISAEKGATLASPPLTPPRAHARLDNTTIDKAGGRRTQGTRTHAGI